MMLRRRHVGLRCRLLVVNLAVLALVLSTASGLLAFDTEVVSPRTYTINTRAGRQVVPDLAVSGRVLVQLRPGVSRAKLESRLRANNCSLLATIPNTSIAVVELPAGMPVTDGETMWAREAITAVAEPDRLKYPVAVPDDEYYSEQWQWPKIAAPTGWDIETGAGSTIVAVCDSGYDPDHEDLADKYWVNQAELAGTEGVDDDGNGYVDDIYGWDFINDDNDPDAGPGTDDDYSPGSVSHGSHCAGLVGAITNNGTGVAGHDWACQLMMVRVLGFDGGTDATVTAGVQYAIDNGADVVSLSLGGGYSSIYNSVFANANAAGVVVVAAAGNESWVFTDDQSTWMSPVCNDGPNLGTDNFVLGVGATDSADIAAGFTNRDASSYNFVDVMAPGVDVLSCMYYDPSFPDLGQLYGPMSGTSMACPIAAGLAGLVKGHTPSMSADEIIEQIRMTCDDISAENPMIADTLGEGRINTAAALGIDVPPDPVGNLQAYDTLGDEGGSITVTWELSPQDDQDVVAYNLLRAGESSSVPGTPGTFAQIEQLDPGTSFYLDAVPDHTPFWYQVVTVDQSNSVPSDVAGPAEARDDLAPDPIENLAAVDTQADEGGSISLSWYGYEYPEDLEEYHIYRDTDEFDDVAQMEPIATTTLADGQHYVDATTEDGTQYYYAVTGLDEEENENTQVTVAGPVVSNPNFAFNYPPGLSIIAIGATPAAPASTRVPDILGFEEDGTADLAYWDPQMQDGAGYVVYSNSPNAAVFTQQLGRAWWLRSDEARLVNISGAAAEEGVFERQVVSGWNMLGNPFPQRMDFGATEVTGIGQGTPVSLQTSNQLGYTRDYAWAYDPFTSSYRLVTGTDLPFATGTIDKGRGVLLMSRRPATLLLSRASSTAAVGGDEVAELDGWALQITARAQDVADTDNFLGVSPRAAELGEVISPPRPDADLDLYFVRSGAEGARLATDFAAEEGRTQWQMRVACAMPDSTVRLSWPDLTQLPADCRPVLIDEETGEATYLRTSTGYTYETGDQPTQRHFTLRISDDSGSLAISALAVGANAGRAQVAYSLSQDASVDIEVLNIAGITVRRLVADRQQQAGTQQIAWDGRAQSGSPVPAGTYLVRIQARSAGGQQVSAVRSLQLER